MTACEKIRQRHRIERDMMRTVLEKHMQAGGTVVELHCMGVTRWAVGSGQSCFRAEIATADYLAKHIAARWSGFGFSVDLD